MSTPVRISVIVPVYNVEPYLEQCLDSILASTFKDFEIVCVDDASPDRSGEILDRYAKQDPRVRVIHAETNEGLSRARNIALDHAVGDYIILIDSDDWIEPDFLSDMYEKAHATDADRISCGLTYYFEDEPEKDIKILEVDPAAPNVGWVPCTPETISEIHFRAPGMMIRRSVLEKHHFRFPEGCLCEDLYFHYLVYPWCHRAAQCRQIGYLYRRRAGAIMVDFIAGQSLAALDHLKVALMIWKDWKQRGIAETYRIAFLKLLVYCIRCIRKYAPHHVQKDVTGQVSAFLRTEDLYHSREDDAYLTKKERRFLHAWQAGKSEMGLSYYWKRLKNLFR